MAPAGEKTPLVRKKDASEEPPPPSCCAVLLRRLSSVTLEPAILLHSVAYGVEGVFRTNMLLDKTCANQLRYGEEVCDDLDSGSHREEQDAVQRATNDYSLYCAWTELLPAVLALVLLGASGDAYGRKLPLLLPLAGSTLKALGLALNAHWWALPPVYVLLCYVPSGLTGGAMAVFAAASAYVGGEAGRRSRTTRLSVLSVTVHASVPIGHAGGAYLFDRGGGYVSVFGAEFLLSLLSVLYVLVRIKNEPPKKRRRRRKKEEDEEAKVEPSSEDEEEEEEEAPKLSLKRIKESFLVAFKERENGARAQILGHICCISLYVMTFGSMSFLYVYTRKKFKWNYYDYTMWSIFSTPLSFVGSCVLLPLLSYYWLVEDGILGFLGSASQILYGVLLGTAPVPWVLYLAQLASACSSMIITSSRSVMSKLVDPDELGALYAVVGVGEGLLPIFSTPLYTALYNGSLDAFPGAIFIANSGISLVVSCIYVWLITTYDPPKDRKAETP